MAGPYCDLCEIKNSKRLFKLEIASSTESTLLQSDAVEYMEL